MEESVSVLPGIGSSLKDKLEHIGLATVGDLLQYFPRDYRDESNLTKLGQAKLGHITTKVTFSSVIARRSRKGMHLTEAIATDSTGSVKVIWFKQPYRAQQLSQGGKFYMSGELAFRQGRVSMISPAVEAAEEKPLHTGRIVPVYRESGGLTSKQFRRFIDAALAKFEFKETLPQWLISENQLISRQQAYRQIHFPDSLAELESARHRLGFEELLGFLLASGLNRQELKLETAPSMPFELELAKSFVAKLPFKLTDAQRKVIWQMYQDMALPKPANRLVEGDVGSGKTVVAAMAVLMALHHGYQAAFMAPTELLARQHAESFRKLLEPVGKANQVGLLVGSLDAQAKKRAHRAIEESKVGLVVGTHALIQDAVRIPKLGLIIVDEQHRFGVAQRKKLETKAKLMPHSFYLTATPIPRSLALTLYGEMDVSILDEKPAGRKPVETTLHSAAALTEVLREIEATVKRGEQAFVVCPLISKKDNPKDLTAAENMWRYLNQNLSGVNVGLLHGKMKSADKEAVMSGVVEGAINVLVATTVIEVGVDVPNAGLMVIMGAERFGLAQLHQLRGRVGRSGKAARCLLVVADEGASPRRLQTMTYTNEGFKLAEYDMKLRGPGAIYGTLQHGALDLKIAKLTDVKLIRKVRQAALQFIARDDITDWPNLLARTDLLRSVTYLN